MWQGKQKARVYLQRKLRCNWFFSYNYQVYVELHLQCSNYIYKQYCTWKTNLLRPPALSTFIKKLKGAWFIFTYQFGYFLKNSLLINFSYFKWDCLDEAVSAIVNIYIYIYIIYIFLFFQDLYLNRKNTWNLGMWFLKII